jgi:glutaredoxin 2
MGHQLVPYLLSEEHKELTEFIDIYQYLKDISD